MLDHEYDYFCLISRVELAQLAHEFYEAACLSKCIGAVDGTHVRILAPTREEGAFINRKGEHTINV